MTGGKVTFRDPETGRWQRRCSVCKEVKDLEENYSKDTATPTGSSKDWSYRCRTCGVAHGRAIEQAQRADPVLGPQLRAHQAEIKRTQRRDQPEIHRAAVRRHRRKVKANPRKHAKYLEAARMQYHLRRERAGLPRRAKVQAVVLSTDRLPSLPAKPLADFIEREMASRNLSLEEVARMTSVDTRSIRAWIKGERRNVQFDLADRVLTALDGLWFDIWPDAETRDRMAAA